jgi:Tfp pilus assembly protein PilX
MNRPAPDLSRPSPTAGTLAFASAESARRYAEHQELRALEAAVNRVVSGRESFVPPSFRG